MSWPDACVLLLTYDRLSYAEQTLRSTLENVRYSGTLGAHIADDGSSQEYRDHLASVVSEYFPCACGVTNSERRGYGGNYNLALQAVHDWAEIILPLEDDWALVRPLDLDPLVLALGEGNFDCIRLGYLGYTQPLRAEFVSAGGSQYLLFDPESPEPHVWTGHPRLETKHRQIRIGPWQEGLDPGSTEFEVAHRTETRYGVAWPADLVHPRGDLFAHIGSLPASADCAELQPVEVAIS